MRILLSGFIMYQLLACYSKANAQMITGVWKGKVNKQKVELKIIQKGDSLLGTAYYYINANVYRRYNIKGLFSTRDNAATWWDEAIIEEQEGRVNLLTPGKTALLSTADFNCPGGKEMFLEGDAVDKLTHSGKGKIELQKAGSPMFRDEWDDVIERYTVGANHPYIIDSVAQIHRRATAAATPAPPKAAPVEHEPPPAAIASAPVTPAKPLSIEEKFGLRTKVPALEIPLEGDSVVLHFYDNAEIDGDSISLFLNDRLLHKHIFLTDKPFVVNLAIADLQPTNELVMVAENMGSIPPNTSFMLAYVNGKRYEARLESTEGSSAMIRFNKPDN